MCRLTGKTKPIFSIVGNGGKELTCRGENESGDGEEERKGPIN